MPSKIERLFVEPTLYSGIGKHGLALIPCKHSILQAAYSFASHDRSAKKLHGQSGILSRLRISRNADVKRNATKKSYIVIFTTLHNKK
jgi:hypothetical protein